ncbi:GNAT family N-acetyltransferase [Streptomyces sp. NPDC048172]|uniref:GNAT family N-acetyltransferase n=1 Tax=Streptomyces sp. NPDC048172 TaxID=3365505 RepID=UPI003715F0FB
MGAGSRDVRAVRAVRDADVPGARELLHAAFRTDPVSRWIFPGEEHCETWHPLLFSAFLEGARRYGTAEMTADGTAVALWFDTRNEPPGLEETGELLGGVDPANPRVHGIGETTGGIHPHEPHAYLQALAVRPGLQSRGIGGALLRLTLDRCDKEELPAYLEASSARSRAFYERHGFALRGAPLRLPDGGPPMWPMWREPGAGGATGV